MPPENRTLFQIIGTIPRNAARSLVKTYQYVISPLLGSNCRYLPTCSEYAEESLRRHGLWAGGWMTLARVCRCHPWGNSGLDFVCDEIPSRARWYRPWRYGLWRGTNEAPPKGQGFGPDRP